VKNTVCTMTNYHKSKHKWGKAWGKTNKFDSINCNTRCEEEQKKSAVSQQNDGSDQQWTISVQLEHVMTHLGLTMKKMDIKVKYITHFLVKTGETSLSFVTHYLLH